MSKVTGDIKLAIRQDNEAGLVRAFFSTMDGSDAVLVATISVGLVRACPKLFDAWKTMLRESLDHLIRMTGAVPVRWFEQRPHQSN